MFIRVVTAKTVMMDEEIFGIAILGDWEPPSAMNDEKFGEPEPDAPKPVVRPKLKMGTRK